nr:hypothetical protein [Methylobacterium sp. L1A1]
MSGNVLSFTRAAQSARPTQRAAGPLPSGYGGHVCIVDSEAEGFVGFAVLDESASGDSAGHHGWFTDHAEAFAEARAVAERINAASFTDYSKGGAA